jgi:hypothetical protein
LFNREVWPYSSALSLRKEANRYQVIALQATDGWRVHALHAANRHLRILVYQDVLVSQPSDPQALTTCTSYATDDVAHPDWFLAGQSGHRLIEQYANNYVMDVGNPSYQRACTAHAARLARRYGFDGFLLDDATAWVGWVLPAGQIIPSYPSRSAWQAAMTSLLRRAAPAAHARRVLAFSNVGGAPVAPGLWQRWSSLLDGSEEESWANGGLGPAQQLIDWPFKLANVAWSEAHGKYTILHSYDTTEAGSTYGLASMMLVANGKTSYSTANAGYSGSELWFPEYATAQRLGAPTGAYRRRSNGVYERRFQRGLVLVNPSLRRIHVSLTGGPYSGSGLTRVGSVTLGPTTGVILRRAG